MEEKLKNKIKELYQQLIEEEKGKYTPCGYMYILPPNGSSYYHTAIELFHCAVELSRINKRYHINELVHTMTKEVEYVKDFEYKYDRGAKSPNKRSIDEMVSLMQNATRHIYRDFVAILD